jgi:hypothetical protein
MLDATPALPVDRTRRPHIVMRALRLPLRRKYLWARSLPIVALMRLGLWTTSMARLQVLVSRLARGRYGLPLKAHEIEPQTSEASEAQVLAASECVWAVSSSARVIPGASCLTQALALQVLLGRRGLSSRLCLGVNTARAGKFRAHAWVEWNGRVIIGGSKTERWTPLTAWDFEVDSSLK